jgi:pyrroline-5-carboxylate reductase
MYSIDTIGLVGGGQMGEALLRGMINSELLAPGKIMVLEPDSGRAAFLQQKYGVRLANDPAVLAAECPVIIIAVKPQIMPEVLAGYADHITVRHLIISIAAGISIRTLENSLGAETRIIRVMPNTPALVLAGASALSANRGATSDDIVTARRIFSAIGICVEVSESMLDAVTGLSGSGPGYVFTFIEALIDGGVLAGLPRDTAEKLVLQTVFGAAKLAIESGEPPAVLKGRVTSPGGTTITGLQVLEESGFRGSVMTAVEAATERSRELGQ